MTERIRIIIDADDQASGEIKKSQRSLDNLQSTVLKVGAVMTGLAITGRQVYQAIGEGAELNLARQRFDQLATSIGTTSDALLTEFSEATGGMLSNAEMVASASQIISTGLASNQQDVIRLARVVSELGLDMGQVILTFANNSKMRLDSLGLAVSDVEQRTDELVAAGQDMDSAFDQAVLEGLEERLALVGSAADTAAGDIRRFNAEFSNFANTIKQKAAESAAPWFASVNNIIDAHRELNRAQELGLITDEKRARLQEEIWFYGLTEEVQARVDAVTELQREAEGADQVLKNYARTTEQATKATVEIGAAWESAKASLEEYGDELQRITTYEDRREGIDSSDALWQQMIDQYEAEQQAIEEVERAAASLRRELAGSFIRGMDEYIQGIDEGELATRNLVDELLRMGPELGFNADQMRVLAGATGEYSPEAIEAALRTMELDHALDLVGQALVENETNAFVAADAMGLYQDVISGDFNLEVDYDDLTQAEREALDLLVSLGLIDGYKANATVTVSWINSGPVLSTANTAAMSGFVGANQARASGGPVAPGVPYLVGERGPEWFVPNQSGTVLPNGQSPGSTYNDNRTIVNNFRSRDAAALGMAQAQLERDRLFDSGMGV